MAVEPANVDIDWHSFCRDIGIAILLAELGAVDIFVREHTITECGGFDMNGNRNDNRTIFSDSIGQDNIDAVELDFNKRDVACHRIIGWHRIGIVPVPVRYFASQVHSSRRGADTAYHGSGGNFVK